MTAPPCNIYLDKQDQLSNLLNDLQKMYICTMEINWGLVFGILLATVLISIAVWARNQPPGW
jgi:type III secretory pathway component EscT